MSPAQVQVVQLRLLQPLRPVPGDLHGPPVLLPSLLLLVPALHLLHLWRRLVPSRSPLRPSTLWRCVCVHVYAHVQK